MLMEAYAHYQANQYDDAIEDAQRFISLHPGNESAPYAYYLIAHLPLRAHSRRRPRPGHHRTRARRRCSDVVRRYPDSAYARDARLKLDMVYDQLAGKEMDSGPLLLDARPASRGHQPLPQCDREPELPAHHARAGSAASARRSLPLGWHDRRGAAYGGDPRPQLPGQINGTSARYALMTDEGVAPVADEEAQRRGWLRRTFGAVF